MPHLQKANPPKATLLWGWSVSTAWLRHFGLTQENCDWLFYPGTPCGVAWDYWVCVAAWLSSLLLSSLFNRYWFLINILSFRLCLRDCWLENSICRQLLPGMAKKVNTEVGFGARLLSAQLLLKTSSLVKSGAHRVVKNFSSDECTSM